PSGRRMSLAATYSSPSWADAWVSTRTAGFTVIARTTRLNRHAPTRVNDAGATRATPQTMPPSTIWERLGRIVAGARAVTRGVASASQPRNSPPPKRANPTRVPTSTAAIGSLGRRGEAIVCTAESSRARVGLEITPSGQDRNAEGAMDHTAVHRTAPRRVRLVNERAASSPRRDRRVGHPYHCGRFDRP